MNLEVYYQQFLQSYIYPRKLTTLRFSEDRSVICYDSAGNRLINFSSNDYLGLSQHSLLKQKSKEYLEKYGTGINSSRLVSGNLDLYEECETKLAKLLNKPSALILQTGYQTNSAILNALLDRSVLKQSPLVFCDRYCHNSMLVDAKHMSGFYRFKHNDINHLDSLLSKFSKKIAPKFILLESLYSMEGDKINLREYILLAKKYNAFLYVDDAHAVGIYGPNGAGLAVEYSEDISIIMGTFSKALGSMGGYIGCSLLLKEYFIHRCKGLIYSTSLSPAVLGSISAVLDLLPTLERERIRLQTNMQKLKNYMNELNLPIGRTATHIIPWIIGSAEQTRVVSKMLAQKGILATAIQPPSVPINQARIRFCLSAAHTDSDIEKLMQAIDEIIKTKNVIN